MQTQQLISQCRAECVPLADPALVNSRTENRATTENSERAKAAKGEPHTEHRAL